MDNFNNILNSLNELTKSYSIFVPSLNKEIKINGFTAKQQKEAIQCVMDKDFAGISFAILVSEMLLNNLVEKTPILLSDKNYVLVCLRALSLSTQYKNSNGESIDLSAIVNNKTPLPDNLKTETFTDNDITITIENPTLQTDIFVNSETKKKLLSINPNQTLSRESLGDLYIDEILKYVKHIKTPKAEIKSDELTFNQKYQIVEKLPLSATTKIVSFINNIKDFEKSLLLPEKEINIDPTLFTV
jgi:hypothetical protein